MDRPFALGFMGTTTNEVLFEAAEYVLPGDVFMPFTGSGKDISWLSEEGRTIYSADTQFLSKCMVDGIFNSPEEPKSHFTNTPFPEMVEGWATENIPFKRVPEKDFRIIDTMGKYGTLYDKAVLCKAIIRATIGGRLTHWQLTDGEFMKIIRSLLDYNLQWTNLPGKRIHHFGSVYDILDKVPEWNTDTIWIDPPKVVDTQDVYSRNFWRLNSCLTQETETLPKWKYMDVIPRHKLLWALPCKRIIQFYCSDVRPTDDQVRVELEKFGTIKQRIRMAHGGRADYIYVVDKE